MNKYFLVSLLLFSYSAVNAGNTFLQDAISDSHRSELNKKRDHFRHPLETLNFFEVERDMSVVEIWPGGKAWYTEILAPYLKEKGKLYAAHFSEDSQIPYFKKNRQKFNDKLNANPEIYGSVVTSVLQPPKTLEIAPKASVDRVLTFRNIHNWMKNGQADAVFNAMYTVLKPNGILGVVEHRAKVDSKQDPKALSGYVTEAYIIALAEKAGFKLLDKSEINSNANDTTDYIKGVWTLPPSLRLKEQDREKYLAIGESDRMTLKFIKK